MLIQVIKEMRRRKRVDLFASRTISRNFNENTSVRLNLEGKIGHSASYILNFVPPDLVDDVIVEVNKRLQTMVMDEIVTERKKEAIVHRLSENLL